MGIVLVVSASRCSAQAVTTVTRESLDQIVLENFVLEEVPLIEALKKWKHELTLVSGGKPQSSFVVERIDNLSSREEPQANTPIQLSFRYVLAGECLRRIIDQGNIRAKEVYFELDWYDESRFRIESTSSPRGLAKAREVRFKEFKVSDDSLLNLVKEWRAAVKRYGESDKNEIYYQAYEFSDTFKVPQRIELNLVDVAALEALDAICHQARATVKWDDFELLNEKWDFEVSHTIGSEGEMEWKNKEGKTVKAAFVALGPLTVKIRPSGGKIVDYPLENLSPESLVQALRQGRSGFE